MKQVKWLVLATVVFVGSALLNRACTDTATGNPVAKITNNQQISTPQPTAPLRLAKPNTPPNPKYDTTLSAAQPAEEQKIRAEWYAYDQQECTDETLAKDKKDLVKVQSVRLQNLKSTYKHIISHNEGDAVAVLRGTRYLDRILSVEKDPSKLIFTTPCLVKRGEIPQDASDLNIIQMLIKGVVRKLIESYDAKYTSSSMAEFVQWTDNYKLRVLGAEEALKSIK